MAQAERASTFCSVPDVEAESAYVSGVCYCPQTGPVYWDSLAGPEEMFHSSVQRVEGRVRQGRRHHSMAGPCVSAAVSSKASDQWEPLQNEVGNFPKSGSVDAFQCLISEWLRPSEVMIYSVTPSNLEHSLFIQQLLLSKKRPCYLGVNSEIFFSL